LTGNLKSDFRDSTKILKDSASTKSKSYVALVQVTPPVNIDDLLQLSSTTNIMLDQRTPTRVPRRADMVRKKIIEWINIKPVLNETGQEMVEFFNAEMRTSAGTYVKEFIHGDDGRTIPSLRTLLGCESARCVQLDVLAVHLDWPSKLSE
jgi:tRNA pseudouridine synthase 10